jgi:hypothetical protein
MKIFSIIFMTTLISFTSIAQEKKELPSEISAKAAIKSMQEKNNVDAFNTLVKAKAETHQLIYDEFISSLPKTVGAWTLYVNDEGKAAMTQQQATLVPNEINLTYKYFEAGTGNKGDLKASMNSPMAAMTTPSLTVSYTKNQYTMAIIKAVYDENEAAEAPKLDADTKKTTVKGNLGLVRYIESIKQGEISLIVGNGIFLISGNKIENADILAKLGEAIDYTKFKGLFKE